MNNNIDIKKDVIVVKDYKNEPELMRRKVWIDAWTRTSSASNCQRTTTATRYADAALVEFEKRFSILT